jgi:hypothetical protein
MIIVYAEYIKSKLGESIDLLASELKTIKWSGNKKTNIDWIIERVKSIDQEAYTLWEKLQKENKKETIKWINSKIVNLQRYYENE